MMISGLGGSRGELDRYEAKGARCAVSGEGSRGAVSIERPTRLTHLLPDRSSRLVVTGS